MLLTYYSPVAQGQDHLHFQKIEELARHSLSCFASQTSSCKQFRLGVSKIPLTLLLSFATGEELRLNSSNIAGTVGGEGLEH